LSQSETSFLFFSLCHTDFVILRTTRRYLMKKAYNVLLYVLLFVCLALYLTACAPSSGGSDSGGGGSGSPTSPVVDSTPHDYKVQVGREAWGSTGGVTMTLVCDFGLPTERTYGGTMQVLNDSNHNPSYSCSGAKNVTITVLNNDNFGVVYGVYVDGVLIIPWDRALPGQTYTFQRGF